MDRNTPSEWTEFFVKTNKRFCVDRLIEINNTTIDLVRSGNPGKTAAAVVGLNQLMNGFGMLHNAGIANMKPFIATASFIGGFLLLNCTEYPEDKRRSAAMDAFQDCMDFSNGGVGKYAAEIIGKLKSGVSFKTIMSDYCPDYPDEPAHYLEDISKRIAAFR